MERTITIKTINLSIRIEPTAKIESIPRFIRYLCFGFAPVLRFCAVSTRCWIRTLRQTRKYVNAALVTLTAFIGRELNS
jgi:hypothetical protein